MRPGGGDDGFTILELVVCLGLLAIIAAFMAEGVALIGRGHAVMDRVEREESVRAVRMHMRRTVERAVPVFAARDGGAAAIVFTGQPDRLQFATRSDPRLEGGALVLAEFRIEDRSGGKALVTIRRPLSSAEQKPEPLPLLDGVATLGLRYFGRFDAQSPVGWSAEWSNQNALPQLVEFSLEMESGPARNWPPLIVAVAAAAPHEN